MKLSIVFTVMNQHSLADYAIESAMNHLSYDGDVEVLIIDNGSDTVYQYSGINHDDVPIKYIRHDKSIGVYPTFWDAQANGISTGHIVAFFHSDLIICDDDWDMEIVRAFEQHPKMGLLGFIGSNEIDSAGGRGLGTTSNFMGEVYPDVKSGRIWKGSPAHVHGKVSNGFSNAAVVDGCAMVFRRNVLEGIAQRMGFPPHHFYDKLLSCEVREKGYTVGVLGIACDHISGQTVNQENNYQTMAEEWCRANLPESKFVGEAGHWSWDMTVYAEAERQWLHEYRDQKHLIPYRV